MRMRIYSAQTIWLLGGYGHSRNLHLSPYSRDWISVSFLFCAGAFRLYSRIGRGIFFAGVGDGKRVDGRIMVLLLLYVIRGQNAIFSMQKIRWDLDRTDFFVVVFLLCDTHAKSNKSRVCTHYSDEIHTHVIVQFVLRKFCSVQMCGDWRRCSDEIHVRHIVIMVALAPVKLLTLMEWKRRATKTATQREE